MFYSNIFGVECAIRLDWLSFGLRPALVDGVPSCDHETLANFIKNFLGLRETKKVGPWYFNGCDGLGVRMGWGTKPGVRNDQIAIDLSGAFFAENYELGQELLENIYCYGWGLNPYRFDVCIDFPFAIDSDSLSFKVIGRMDGGYHLDDQKVCTGFWCGKGDLRFRFYDKQKERLVSGVKSDYPWWRYEAQIRGEMCKLLFSGRLIYGLGFSDIEIQGIGVMGSDEKVRINPEWIQEKLKEIFVLGMPSYPTKKISFSESEKRFWLGESLKVVKYYENAEHRFGKNTISHTLLSIPDDVLVFMETKEYLDWLSED